MSTKPSGSLSNQNVLDIVEALDKLIEEASKAKIEAFSENSYSMYLAEEIAYMRTRNLILSKI